MSGPTRADIRAAISDAYYEARNAGKTMEEAADDAADAIRQLIRSRAPTVSALHEGLRSALRYHNLHEDRGDQHCTDSCATAIEKALAEV